MPDLITIQTDRGALSLPSGITLDDALAHILSPQQPPHQIATAVNGAFVPRPARANHVLSEGETVLCFAPITGG